MKTHFVGLPAAVVAMLLTGGIVPAVAGASTSHAIGVTTRQSEAVALREVKWTSNVVRTVAKGSWTFKSEGLPASNFVATNYAVPSNPLDVSASGASVIASANVLSDQNYDYTLPLTPVYTKKVTTANQGPIGVLLDGAALYNPYEANHSTVATSDNFIASENGVSASFLDSCDGHPGPGGQYHYHGLPTCLVSYATGGSPTVTSVTSLSGKTTSAVDENNAASRRPVILGFAFDGFGIYDNVAMNGRTIPVSSLDSCNGIFSPVPGYPHGVYHYVLENVKGARSSLGCFHGVVSSAYTQALEGLLSEDAGPVSSSVSVVAHARATAFTLAANRSEDEFLLTMLRLSYPGHLC
jgi:YHYH protein